MSAKQMSDNWHQYCKDKREINETPVPYINWLKIELMAFMDYYKCAHKNIDFEEQSDSYTVSNYRGLSTPSITHYYECPDCREMIEGGTEGGV